jgi:EpsI family protein
VGPVGQNHKEVIAAAVAAGMAMCLFGLIYRVVAAPVDKAPLDPQTLQGFPLQIGEWTGQDSPIDPTLRKAIDADSYVNRRYSRRDGLASILLYLPCGTNASALLQHIPENCYVGAGWTLVNRRPVVLPLDGGRQLPCSIAQFARGGLDLQKLVLLHFLMADGEYFTTFFDIARAKGWRHFAGISYAAQVQIVASADNVAAEEATRLVTDFARAAVPVIEQFLENRTPARPVAESRED